MTAGGYGRILTLASRTGEPAFLVSHLRLPGGGSVTWGQRADLPWLLGLGLYALLGGAINFPWEESDALWPREVLGYVTLGKGMYLKPHFAYL